MVARSIVVVVRPNDPGRISKRGNRDLRTAVSGEHAIGWIVHYVVGPMYGLLCGRRFAIPHCWAPRRCRRRPSL